MAKKEEYFRLNPKTLDVCFACICVVEDMINMGIKAGESNSIVNKDNLKQIKQCKKEFKSLLEYFNAMREIVSSAKSNNVGGVTNKDLN